jgi:hypothetical protein
MPRTAQPQFLSFEDASARRQDGDQPPYHLTAAERRALDGLQREALGYFIDNQLAHGLVLDRQRNHGPLGRHGLCSTAATGMGLIALTLAAAPEYHLLERDEARERVQTCLGTALERLPADHGMLPHFVDAQTLAPAGMDPVSTIDSAWLAAGALWAGAAWEDGEIRARADRLYARIDWPYWTGGRGDWLLHGKGRDGIFLRSAWNRQNAETAFLYVLAVGADAGRALPASCWDALETCPGHVAGLSFPSADLGLFVFQYSLELLDFEAYPVPGARDLRADALLATRANYLACRSATRFRTYRDFWGLSAGDGPGDVAGPDRYRCYSPAEALDGTAHLTATLASIASGPELVLENVRAAEAQSPYAVHGRYGYSNINIDREWCSRDVVGIDVGAAALAIDNFLYGGRVRRLFHTVACVDLALGRLCARPRCASAAAWRQAS